ncbi:MAG: hypothetical protein VYD49_01530, partial [Pseudomonadota bacterium]|nr:hypothetical protein [Pseudomonadota bacterium]
PSRRPVGPARVASRMRCDNIVCERKKAGGYPPAFLRCRHDFCLDRVRWLSLRHQPSTDVATATCGHLAVAAGAQARD